MRGACEEHESELVWTEVSDGYSVHEVAHCELCFEEKGSDCKFWSTSEYYEDFIVDDEIKAEKENKC